MYENNYNYIDIPEDNNDNRERNSGNGGKTLALILAVALIGGASGFGGAYLENRLIASSEAAVAAPAPEPAAPAVGTANNDTEMTTTAAPTNMVSSLLNTTPENGSLTTKQIVEKVSPSVVGVHSTFNQVGTGTGTGIILSSDGYIITNAHVVQTETQEYVNNGGNGFGNGYGNGFGGYGDIFDYFFGGNRGGSYEKVTKNADKVTVVLSDDGETEYEAEIIGADKDSDLAVLKINAEGLNLTAAEFGNSDELTMGDKAVAIGYPLGLGLSTSEGIVSGLNRTLNVELSGGGSAPLTLIQTDAAINPGNSGGPLVNEFGQVVGITSSKLVNNNVEGMGFAIPITDAMPLISDLMNNGYIITPQIGITGSDINSAMMRYYNLPVDKGVMVVSVTENGAAAAAGICAGDVIVGADGKDIATMSELTAAKAGKSVGDKMTLTLARADGNIDVEITLTGGSATEEG